MNYLMNSSNIPLINSHSKDFSASMLDLRHQTVTTFVCVSQYQGHR